MTDRRLAALLADAAAEATGVAAAEEDGVTTWSTGGTPFVALNGSTVEFRLDAVVGAAARRTPDTSASTRGDAWVAFRPADLDQYGEDRIRAWFAAARRRASA